MATRKKTTEQALDNQEQPEEQAQEWEAPKAFAKAAEQTVIEVPFEPTPHTHPTPGDTGENNVDEAKTEQDKRVFTQEELDRILKERIERERRKYADYDELKAKLTEIEESQKTEEEKLRERLAELEQQAQTAQMELQEKALRLAIAAEASKVGLDPEAAYRLADLSKVEIDDDGQVVGASDVVQEVAENYPGLLKQPTPRTSPANPARSSGPAKKTDADRIREYFSGGGGGFWQGGGVVTVEE